jgi:uncharacterized protein YjbI with pentapeptide repeats
LTVLPRLDRERKRSVLQFLYESDLIKNLRPVFIELSGADLRKANLSFAILSKVNLYGAILDRANLTEANLSGAILSGANLSRANLGIANLSVCDQFAANLCEANLKDAIGTTPEQLKQASSLKDATMPDGSIHP